MLFCLQIWYQNLTLRSTTPKEKQKKRINHQRNERYEIKGVVTKAKLKSVMSE